MRFTKMHGLGNDYVYLDGTSQDLTPWDLPELSRLLSDRHFGIGGDGLILILPSDQADFRMRVFNSDGSEAEMCGNAMRCFARYVYEHGLTDRTELSVETGAGLIRPSLLVQDGKVQSVRVDMGEPRLTRGLIPMTGAPDEPAQNVLVPLQDFQYQATCVSMGNPHCVIFVDEICDYMVQDDGPMIECHELFPRKTNVEFAHVIGRDEVQMRVWERGAGETMACGTGACATTVAAILGGHCARAVTVHLLGGDLRIEWSEADNHVYMTGPATEVCSGEVSEELIAPAML
jgi:diaminopimelate epimerase